MFQRLALLHRLPFLPRLASNMSDPTKNIITKVKAQDRSNLFPFSSRLEEGRALAEDVWSIYKYVHFCRLWS